MSGEILKRQWGLQWHGRDDADPFASEESAREYLRCLNVQEDKDPRPLPRHLRPRLVSRVVGEWTEHGV